eukprot:SAG31_NODE_3131_length_4641_cov_1.488771_2_plen_73_part_00
MADKAAPPGQGKVAEAIRQRIENGKFYEAQQMYRTQVRAPPRWWGRREYVVFLCPALDTGNQYNWWAAARLN